MAKHLRDLRENFIYLILWLVLFLAPVVSLYMRTLNDSAIQFAWNEIFIIWKVYAVYLVVFLIHNFLLAPLLIHRNRKLLYFATTACLLAVFVVYQCSNRPDNKGRNHPQDMAMHAPEPEMGDAQNMPQRPAMPEGPGPAEGAMPPEMPDGNFRLKAMGNKQPPAKKKGKRKDLRPILFGGKEVMDCIMMFLLLGMNLGIKLYFRAEKRDEEMKQLEQENLATQLEHLKYQINPHFFMNTLNNIHALVDIDPELAKKTILELSKMMRYILYEGNKAFVPLDREVAFLQNYMQLMMLRYTDRVKISLDVPQQLPNKEMPPLLLINFVENAFKHGISYKKESFVNIEIRIAGDRLYFGCRNSRHEESTKQPGGVGLANVRKRLQLIYAGNYALDICTDDNIYRVQLDIPLHTPKSVAANDGNTNEQKNKTDKES